MEKSFTSSGLPYLTLPGKAKDRLVVLPSLNDVFQGVHASRKGYARFFRPYSGQATITVLGRPHPFPRDWNFETLAERTAAGIDEIVGTGTTGILGASMGGLLGMRVAALRPDHVHTLVVETSALQSDALNRTVEDAIGKVESGDVHGFVQLLACNTFTGWRNLYLRAALPVLRLYLAVRPPDRESLLAVLRTLERLDLRPYAQDIRAKTLIIGGAEDAFFPPDALRETASLIPGSQLILLDGVGHGAPLERKREVDHAILEFLAQ